MSSVTFNVAINGQESSGLRVAGNKKFRVRSSKLRVQLSGGHDETSPPVLNMPCLLPQNKILMKSRVEKKGFSM